MKKKISKKVCKFCQNIPKKTDLNFYQKVIEKANFICDCFNFVIFYVFENF